MVRKNFDGLVQDCDSLLQSHGYRCFEYLKSALLDFHIIVRVSIFRRYLQEYDWYCFVLVMVMIVLVIQIYLSDMWHCYKGTWKFKVFCMFIVYISPFLPTYHLQVSLFVIEGICLWCNNIICQKWYLWPLKAMTSLFKLIAVVPYKTHIIY